VGQQPQYDYDCVHVHDSMSMSMLHGGVKSMSMLQGPAYEPRLADLSGELIRDLLAFIGAKYLQDLGRPLLRDATPTRAKLLVEHAKANGDTERVETVAQRSGGHVVQAGMAA
jgi:hypothetical protein